MGDDWQAPGPAKVDPRLVQDAVAWLLALGLTAQQAARSIVSGLSAAEQWKGKGVRPPEG